MSDAHRMHLKGPWQYHVLEGDCAEREGRIKLPAAWQDCFGEFAGQIRYERNFNRPTNLDADEDVYVMFLGIGGTAAVRLNDTDLGAVENGEGPCEFEIKALLQPRNLLTVDVRFEGGRARPGGLWGPVALEIRRSQQRPN